MLAIIVKLYEKESFGWRNKERREKMLRIECIRKKDKSGNLDFYWVAHFALEMEWRNKEMMCFLMTSQVLPQAAKAELVAIVFPAFMNWACSREDCPETGRVAVIGVTGDDVDENHTLLAGKVLQRFKTSYQVLRQKELTQEKLPG